MTRYDPYTDRFIMGDGASILPSRGNPADDGDLVKNTVKSQDIHEITNADRIRAMTDEELAELWWERVDCGECPVHRDCKMTGQDCKKLALDWLKAEGGE